MTEVTGNCLDCGGRSVTLDPDEDRVLYGIFGSYLAEHLPGCSQYPSVTEVEVTKL